VHRHDVRPEDAEAVLADATRDAAGRLPERAVRIDVGHARDVVGLEAAAVDVAG
jgi:hypothetical protein